MNTAVESFEERMHRAFARLKAIDEVTQLDAAAIPVDGIPGRLVPVCELNVADPRVVELFREGRDRFMHLFPTQFRVTTEGTRKWLRAAVLEVDDRIAFLIEDEAERWIGHIGYSRTYAEPGELKLDNMLRVARAPRGLMSAAVRAVLDWGFATARPPVVVAPIFSDNADARRFFNRLGFTEGDLVPLRRHESPGRVDYRHLEPDDDAPPDRHHLRMMYSPG